MKVTLVVNPFATRVSEERLAVVRNELEHEGELDVVLTEHPGHATELVAAACRSGVGAIVVFSAHGVSPAVRAEAEARGLTAIDATCPLVTKVHVQAKRYAADGYTVLLIGHNPSVSVLSARLDPQNAEEDSDGLRTAGVAVHEVTGSWAGLGSADRAPVVARHTARG